jgi:hypothetical protein
MKNRLPTLLFLLLICLSGAGCAVSQPALVADIQVLPQEAGCIWHM